MRQQQHKGRKFYGKLIYHKLLPGLINELDPDREYIPTDSNADPENQTPVYHVPAIPSPPCRTSLLAQVHDAESFAILEKLTRSKAALGKIALYQVDQFHPPHNLSEYIRQSQIVQARRIQAAVEKTRCHSDFGGSMLGPLNSPALSVNAAMLDTRKQPKALFYYAQRFFASILVALLPDEKTETLKAFVVNDTASPITGVLSCRMIAANGEILDTTKIPLRVSPFSKAAAINLPKSLSTPDDPKRTFLSVRLKNNDKTLAENTHFFCPDKQFQWPTADIDLQITPNNENNAWDVTLTSKVPVRDLQITPPQPANISDNYLILLPNEPKEVRILYQGTPPPIRTPLEIFTTNQT
ncbi:MAG: glycoside hydrolase family 2 protein [Planctomycetota bacterium]